MGRGMTIVAHVMMHKTRMHAKQAMHQLRCWRGSAQTAAPAWRCAWPSSEMWTAARAHWSAFSRAACWMTAVALRAPRCIPAPVLCCCLKERLCHHFAHCPRECQLQVVADASIPLLQVFKHGHESATGRTSSIGQHNLCVSQNKHSTLHPLLALLPSVKAAMCCLVCLGAIGAA